MISCMLGLKINIMGNLNIDRWIKIINKAFGYIRSRD